jgi:regulator of RNase E activity RraA
MDPLTAEELEALRLIPTPAIANAVEMFDLRPRTEGYMSQQVSCRFPDLGPVIGYAATATTVASTPDIPKIDPTEYWEHIRSTPSPVLAVFHDLDSPVVAAGWGEVQANIHLALGCVGAITDGAVRDLDEVHETGFHLFSQHVNLSHGYVHHVEYGSPVTVAGLTVHPGDLLVGDQHGVVQVPTEVVRYIPEAARKVEEWERVVIAAARSGEGAFERMKEAINRPRPTMDARQ